MQSAEAHEEQRLRELYRYRILDTPRETEFDGFCELARALLGAEFASIGFFDRDRVWFKATAGFDAVQIPRTMAIGNLIMEHGGLFLSRDLTADPVFCNHPLTGEPVGIRAAVCIPIEVKKGIRIGDLAVFSRSVRDFTDEEIANLNRLHRAIVDRLHLHRARIERQQDHARKAKKDAAFAAQKWELGKQRRLLEQTSRLARIGGWEFDLVAGKTSWSVELFRIMEVDEKSYCPSFENSLGFVRPDAAEATKALFARAIADGQSFETEFPLITANDRLRWVRCLCEAETRRGKVVRLIGTLQDITVQRATEEEVNFIATHDMVTGLLNRAVFQERLDRALAAPREAGASVGLFLVDVDHFKAVNDTLGHHAGDVLLAEVGRRLTRAAAGQCLVARVGGDEFALLAQRCDSEAELLDIGNRMMNELLAPIVYEAESIPVTISAGIAIAPVGSAADQLLKDADIALYEAKGHGRNRFILFDRSMRDELELRHSILRAIRFAIENKELVLYYQPKMSLRTGALAGFEALLRWRRPDGFLAGPNFFGAALEDPQLGQAIGDMVIDQAVSQARRWDRQGFKYDHIAINVSTSQFRRGDLADLVFSTLEKSGVKPASLMVEVTENVLLSKEADNVQSTLVSLAERGVKIALDDFGTGYASLTHLKEFPVDLLKVDRSFVANLADQRESRAIVRGITALAHDLGVAVIAEGVETAAQRDMLRHFGADYGQGYLFARPMPAEQVEATFFEDRDELTALA